MTTTIGQFNVQNLFNRYKLLDRVRGTGQGKPIDPEKAVTDGFHINMMGWTVQEFDEVSSAQRSHTAQVITANAPDILAVQEVENLFALEAFNRHFMKDAGYRYAMAIDGNDPRGIDVGVLSKFPITHMRSHKWTPGSDGRAVFSRDCLEVDVAYATGKVVTLYINHLKSKIGGGEARRLAQATAIAEIVRARFGASKAARYAVLGDLNMATTEAEFAPLAGLGLHDALSVLPEAERWTHAWVKSKNRVEYAHFDHVLLSPALRPKLRGTVLERRGLVVEATRFAGPRFAGVASEGTEASDHCGVFVELAL